MTREQFPAEVWIAVERRDGYGCQASTYGLGSTVPCGPGMVVHHRRLRSQGGLDDLANLVMLCDRHHREVHDRPARAAACGLILRHGG